MPTPWRTVYKSPHKEVRIRSRGQRAASPPPSGAGNTDLSIIIVLGAIIAAYSLLLEFWPFIVIGLVIYGIQARHQRSRRRR